MAEGAAAALLDFLVDLPLLLPQDKKGVLKLIKALDPTGFDLIARSGHGINVFRTAACSSNNIYRVTGMGEVAAAPRDVFELLCNFGLIPEWDVLFKSGQYLTFASDPAGRCEVAHIHIVYGLPGVSQFVSDRDFVLRTVRVFFPNGMSVLFCRSVGPEEEVPGDPGPRPHMIRGHMWDSGYVVVPTSSGCCLNVTLQVDPKGWIPTSVINWSLEAIPLNITRVRAAMERLDPDQLALLPESNRQQGAACTKRPAREQLGRLPEGWPASCFAAGHGGPGNSTPGVHDGVQGRALVRGNSSCSVDSNNAPSCGSFGSLRQSEPGGSEGDEGVQWFDALGG